jgi:hypothetical protein
LQSTFCLRCERNEALQARMLVGVPEETRLPVFPSSRLPVALG